MFRDLVHKKRCVVLVDSFYEWHSEYSAQTGEVAKKQGQYSNTNQTTVERAEGRAESLQPIKSSQIF